MTFEFRKQLYEELFVEMFNMPPEKAEKIVDHTLKVRENKLKNRLENTDWVG